MLALIQLLYNYVSINMSSDYNGTVIRRGHEVTVKSSGFVISATWPWLATTPDTVVHDPQAGDGVVEVKYPFVCSNQSLSDAVES